MEAEHDELAEHRKKCLAVVWSHIHGFSPTRFSVYARAYGPDPLESTAHYIWNMQVSASLLPIVSTTEVLLRNAVDRKMMALHGEMWFDQLGLLREPEVGVVSKAKADAQQKEERRGRLTNHDDIVVELGLRFWANLLKSDYSRTIWNQLLVHDAFPNLPATLPEKRRAMREIMKDACDIRNRVCHGERVIHLPDLERRQADIVKAIRWMSAPIERIVRETDRFPKTWSHGLEECRQLLLDMCPPLEL